METTTLSCCIWQRTSRHAFQACSKSRRVSFCPTALIPATAAFCLAVARLHPVSAETSFACLQCVKDSLAFLMDAAVSLHGNSACSAVFPP